MKAAAFLDIQRRMLVAQYIVRKTVCLGVLMKLWQTCSHMQILTIQRVRMKCSIQIAKEANHAQSKHSTVGNFLLPFPFCQEVVFSVCLFVCEPSYGRKLLARFSRTFFKKLGAWDWAKTEPIHLRWIHKSLNAAY